MSKLLSWGPALLWAALIFYLSSQSWDDAPARFPINDKLVHIVVFGILGAALAWGGRQLAGFWRMAGLVLLGWLYGMSDEWPQSFVPGRDPSMGDFVADAAGVILGFLIARAVFKRSSATGSKTAGT